MKKDIPVFEEWPFKVPAIKGVIEKTQEFTKQLKEAKTQEEAYTIWKKYSKYGDKISNEFTHVQVLFTMYTQDKKYEKAMNKLNEGMPLISAAGVEWNKAMVASKFRPYLEEKLGKFYFTMIDYSLKGFDPKIIEEAQKENDLCMKYGALLASAKIPFRGQTYNLSQMGKFMQDLDRETRRESSEAYYGYLETIQDQLEDIYDQLVHLRDSMAKKLGYKNFVELGYIKMNRFDYTPEMVGKYREAIKENVTPLAAKLYKEQFKRTQIKNPQVYDLSLAFKDGNPTPIGTTAEKIENAKKMYDQLSEDTSYFFKFMADHHLLDLEAREGKQGGGYMTYFPTYGCPIIFSNFNGTAGDVDVLTHEFGHSFQSYAANKIKVPEFRAPTLESCEIHSMSMEFFAEPYMNLFFKPADVDKYHYVHLADSITFLPYGVTVDEFQEWVYTNPNATPAERDAKWRELEMKYTPYIVERYGDCAYRKAGHRWLTQHHIFESPFYYIDYTLAQVMAFQFFNLDRKNHKAAWNKYMKLCKMGGKYPFVQLITNAKLKNPFNDGVIKQTIKPLVKVLKDYNI